MNTRPPPPTTAADQQRLALLIEAESIQLKDFVALLAQEEALLVAGDTDALLSLTQKKTERYRQLQRLHADRMLLIGRLGHAQPDEGVQRICAGLPRVLTRWNEVLELARTARERNAFNGKLIVERMANNQAALSILLAASDQPQLYDAHGHSRPTGGGRILGSA